MKKKNQKLELLAPAGNMDSAIAAISYGADSIYVGLDTFSARAYAKNFSLENIKELLDYAHIRNVKVYVTMNTILFEDELDAAFKAVDHLALCGVDAIIVQDLALLNYITSNYPTLEAHISTQMGIDDVNGVKMTESLGAKRVVLGRETRLEVIKQIKEETNISLEVFAHGALCVSYSGNCLMSGLIGLRSGNRGRCVGACRKEYELCDDEGNTINKSYILSTKDLNTVNHLDKLVGYVDTLKIEGRMRDESYVACATKSYREAIDKTRSLKDIEDDLLKTFHRTYTKGYIFGEDKKNISNISKPNNYGFLIGEVIGKTRGFIKIKLSKTLNQLDNIRIASTNEINTCVNKLYNKDMNLTNTAKVNDIIFLEVSEKVNIGDKVYKTKDLKYIKELEKAYGTYHKKDKIDMMIVGKLDEEFKLLTKYKNHKVSVSSTIKLSKAINQATSYDSIYNQLSKLGNTSYELNELKVNIPSDSFIPLKELNELRRKTVELLDEIKTNKSHQRSKNHEQVNLQITTSDKKTITVFATTKEQYLAAKECGISVIYFDDNIIRRNKTIYHKEQDYLLISGLNGIKYYQDKNVDMIADSTLNSTNSNSVIKLLSQGVKRVTLSHELNKKSIYQLIQNLKTKLGQIPDLELIVYGRQTLMETTYCPLKTQNLCGTCQKKNFFLKDDKGLFPILRSDDCEIKILNGKILNLFDNIDELPDISHYRINLTTEDYNESISIIQTLQAILQGTRIKTFNEQTNTRGHFNREIL